MKPLFVIFSCWRDDRQGKNEVCRNTYLARWPGLVDHRFVVGNLDGAGLLDLDMVYVDVPDDYGHLPAKQKAAYRELIKTPYEHFFICYTDTYVHIPRLLAFYKGQDYVGVPYEGRAAGGFGYWLSRQAMEAIANKPTIPDYHSDKLDGHDLAHEGFKLVDMPKNLTAHLSKDTNFYEAQWMRDLHEKVMINDAAL